MLAEAITRLIAAGDVLHRHLSGTMVSSPDEAKCEWDKAVAHVGWAMGTPTSPSAAPDERMQCAAIADRMAEAASVRLEAGHDDDAADGKLVLAALTPTANRSGGEAEIAFLWRWIERAMFDKKIGARGAIEVLACYPGAPWMNGRWNVDHEPYAAEFYKRFPRAVLAERSQNA